MLDDNHDKEMMRNQLIGIILMTLLVMAWFHYYAQRTRQPAPGTQPAPAEQAAPRDTLTTSEQAVESPVQPGAAPGTQWPYLPPVPAQDDPSQDEVTIENESLRLVFTRIGGRLKSAYVLLGDDGENFVQLVPTVAAGKLDTEAVYPMGLRFTDEALGDELDARRFEAEPGQAGRSVTFSLTLPGAAAVRKTFTLSDRSYVLTTRVTYQNLEDEPRVLGMDQTPAFSLNWGPNVSSGDEKKGVKQAVYWYLDGQLGMQYTAKMTSSSGGAFYQVMPGVEWAAVKSAYFVVGLKPEGFEPPVEGQVRMWLRGGPSRFRVGVAAPRFEVKPGETQAADCSLYIGPSELKSLGAAWETLPEVQRFFSQRWDIMDRFAKLLLSILNWFHAHILTNYGVAIIFLTVVVRTVMYPLTLKSMRSMKRMQLLAPEVEGLKEKYGKDPQELQKKMMELYKERGVNPMGGCLPMMLQMPVFITLYRMLWSAYELRGAPFILWITDLSEPDQLLHLPFMAGIPFLGMFEYLNLLPILMGLSMVLSQKMMPTSGAAQNPQQKLMMTLMPVFFSFICYRMASGLNLYIFTSTVLGMVQQRFIPAGDVRIEPKKKKTPRKRQHFYTAAQQRKRQLAKESKQGRKSKRARPQGAKPKDKGSGRKLS